MATLRERTLTPAGTAVEHQRGERDRRRLDVVNRGAGPATHLRGTGPYTALSTEIGSGFLDRSIYWWSMGSRLLFAAALLLLPSTGQAQSRRSDEPLEARPRSSPSEDGSGLGALATAGIVLDVLSIAPLVLFGTSVVFFDEINSTYMNDPIVQLYQSILPPGADPCAQSVAPARVQDLCREAKSWSIIGTMSLVVGGAALLGGTALLIVGLATGGDGDGERAILVPSFGPGYGGLSLAGRL